MKLTPLPITVWARIMVGRPLRVLALSKAPTISEILCPSITMTFQLNALYLSGGFNIIDQFYPGLLSYILYYNPDAFSFLNIGNKLIVKALFTVDKYFFRNIIGRLFSFATLSILKK